MTGIDRIRALPCWQGQIAVEPLSGGLSNESWKVRDAVGMHVVRFGKDYPFHHVERDREVMTARAAQQCGFAPAVRYSAPGVMVSEFVDARTWGEEDVRANPEQVAGLLRDFHHHMPREISGPAFLFWVFHVIRDYALTLRKENSGHVPQIEGYLSLTDAFEAAQVPLPIVFGHHDLLPANILQSGDRLWLIDFEYAGFGTAMFDLAGAASNAGMSDDQAKVLVATYFRKEPAPDLMRSFDAMQCASLLREAMWAMVSELFLDAPGVDYAAYAQENLGRFERALSTYQRKYGKIS